MNKTVRRKFPHDRFFLASFTHQTTKRKPITTISVNTENQKAPPPPATHFSLALIKSTSHTATSSLISFHKKANPRSATYVVIVPIRRHHLSVLPLTINLYSYFYLYHTSPYHHVLFIPPPGSFPPSFTFREYRY